jgi:hypothetical protein
MREVACDYYDIAGCSYNKRQLIRTLVDCSFSEYGAPYYAIFTRQEYCDKYNRDEIRRMCDHHGVDFGGAKKHGITNMIQYFASAWGRRRPSRSTQT